MARVNWDSIRSLHNWMEQMDLYCTAKWQIGFLGSIYYLGFCIGAVLFAKVADTYGRKLCIRVIVLAHFIAFWPLIFTPNLYGRWAIMFVIGVIAAVRASVAINMLMEFVPVRL